MLGSYSYNEILAAIHRSDTKKNPFMLLLSEKISGSPLLQLMGDICHDPRAINGFCVHKFPLQAVNKAAEEWLASCFNQHDAPARIFGQGVIDRKSLFLVGPCFGGRVSRANFGRTGTRCTTRKHDSPRGELFWDQQSPLTLPSAVGDTMTAAGHHRVNGTGVIIYKVSCCSRSMMRTWVTTASH